jgi:potassium/chloride transporter 9
MRPNIVIIGFPHSADGRQRARERPGEDSEDKGKRKETHLSEMTRRSHRCHLGTSDITITGEPMPPLEQRLDLSDPLPTDNDRTETPISACDYVGILEDASALNKGIGIAYGFKNLSLPLRGRKRRDKSKDGRYIDLWPLLGEDKSGWATYTLVLQLGTTLSFVPSWSRHKLRESVSKLYFEYESFFDVRFAIL